MIVKKLASDGERNVLQKLIDDKELFRSRIDLSKKPSRTLLLTKGAKDIEDTYLVW